MNPDELTKAKVELEAFVEHVFASLPRDDQRGKGKLYLRGLMLDGRRKSMQPMGNGAFSPCVARQHSGTLGKIGNCKIGVSIHAATDQASCPLDWRLYVPQLWDDTCAHTNEEAETIQARRAKAGLPERQIP